MPIEKVVDLNSFQHYIEILDELDKEKKDLLLFRGQECDKDLLPKISRKNPKKDTTSLERKMLEEFRRTSFLYKEINISNDWDLLALAQHHGMATRLLDWTTNPLMALWFACYNDDEDEENAIVWIFIVSEDSILDVNKDPDPLTRGGGTRVFKPNIIAKRLDVQSGWFTAHIYSSLAKKFVTLNTNASYKKYIKKIRIPKGENLRTDLLKRLDNLGINEKTVFPDLDGLCNHINWLYIEKK